MISLEKSDSQPIYHDVEPDIKCAKNLSKIIQTMILMGDQTVTSKIFKLINFKLIELSFVKLESLENSKFYYRCLLTYAQLLSCLGKKENLAKLVQVVLSQKSKILQDPLQCDLHDHALYTIACLQAKKGEVIDFQCTINNMINPSQWKAQYLKTYVLALANAGYTDKANMMDLCLNAGSYIDFEWNSKIELYLPLPLTSFKVEYQKGERKRVLKSLFISFTVQGERFRANEILKKLKLTIAESTKLYQKARVRFAEVHQQKKAPIKLQSPSAHSLFTKKILAKNQLLIFDKEIQQNLKHFFAEN